MLHRRILQRAANLLLLISAIALSALAFNLYDPYLVLVRPWLGGTVLGVSAMALMAALLRGSWSTGSRARRLLVLIWCMPPLAITAAEAGFSLHKQAVLRAGGVDAADLGRHFVIGYTRFDDLKPLVAKGLIGGIYVTRHNIAGRTAADLKTDISRLQSMRHEAGLPPLVVMTDQEGGIVSHLSPQLTALPALATLADLPPQERATKAEEFGRTHGRELSQLGVTINLAPVADLRREHFGNHFDINSQISRRAISDDPAIVTDVASNYIRGLDAFHVGATVKHFPGMGRVRGDTHHVRASISASLAELEQTDWRPFRELLAHSNAHLMVGHAAVTAVDPGVPASHSKRLIDALIRGSWGYQGLIISDDMVMSAVYRHDVCSAVVQSLNAGVDLLLITFDGAQYYRLFDCALTAHTAGAVDMAMLQRSRARLDLIPHPRSGGDNDLADRP